MYSSLCLETSRRLLGGILSQNFAVYLLNLEVFESLRTHTPTTTLTKQQIKFSRNLLLTSFKGETFDPTEGNARREMILSAADIAALL